MTNRTSVWDTSRWTVWLGWHPVEKIAKIRDFWNKFFDIELYIDGAQWLTQPGQKSGVECKGKSQPDWVVNKMQLRVEIQA